MSPSADDVRGELERILASEAFANTGRLARLLRYVVERALAGEGDQLKEYVLGVDVFDRGEQYDPRLDSIVRVEARRLRSKLDDYYRNGGADDTVVISIPRGTYAPVFGTRAAAPILRPEGACAAGVSRPVVIGAALAGVVAILAASFFAFRANRAAAPDISMAVLPFEQYSGTPDDERLAERLTDSVTSELARLGSVAVVSRTSARQFQGTRTPLRTIAQTLNANVVMEATLETSSEQIEVTARLVDASTDRKVWAEIFTVARNDVASLGRRIAISAAQAATQRK